MPDPLREHARSEDFELRVGDGWLPLVRECHEAVVAEFPDYELLAAKQKYAELSFQAFPRPGAWTSEENRRLEAIVDVFAERSTQVCEKCGGPGEVRWIDGYELILCDECSARRDLGRMRR